MINPMIVCQTGSGDVEISVSRIETLSDHGAFCTITTFNGSVHVVEHTREEINEKRRLTEIRHGPW